LRRDHDVARLSRCERGSGGARTRVITAIDVGCRRQNDFRPARRSIVSPSLEPRATRGTMSAPDEDPFYAGFAISGAPPPIARATAAAAAAPPPPALNLASHPLHSYPLLPQSTRTVATRVAIGDGGSPAARSSAVR
jgi:hypothetical protein